MIRKKSRDAGDLDLSVFMSLMVVLIPILLAAAEFAKITVIDVGMSSLGSDTSAVERIRPAAKEKLKASLLVTDSTVTIGARGGFLGSIFYKKTDELTWDKVSVLDEQGRVQTGYQTISGELLTDSAGNAVASVALHDRYYLNGSDSLFQFYDTSLVVKAELPLIVQLKSRLRAVNRKYELFEDSDDITIGSEDDVLYDNVVQFLDACNAGGFENVSFAKFRM